MKHNCNIKNINFNWLYIFNTVYKNSITVYPHEEVVMNIKKDFGLRIKELRNKKGITQYQLAEMAGIDPKHISHIETGRSFPKADLIEKFANALEIDYTELFKTQHLDDRKIILKKLGSYLENASDTDLQVIYKLISGYFN